MKVVLALAAALVAVAGPPQQDLDARLRAGAAALAARQYQAAKQEFQSVVSSDPGNAAAHLNLGIIALIENKPEEGLRHFSVVPGERALIGRLDCELRLGRVQDARKTAKQLESAAAHPSAAEHIGKLLAKGGEYAAAALFLRRASGAAAANLLGMVEEKSGNAVAAVKAFGDAARLEPSNEDYRIDHAAMLLNAGHIMQSVGVFRSAAQDFPTSARVRLGLGSALYLAGTYEAAARVLLEAVHLQPAPRAFDLLGKVYEAAGPLQPRIRGEFEKYLNSEPHDGAAFAHYGSILHAAGGDPTPARRALARALEMEPDLAAAHLQLGIVEQTAGNWATALERYKRAAELDPDNAAVRYRLATAYRHVGDQERARAELAVFRRLKARDNPVKD